MKYASSIRYGGLLVDSVDCDENSYKSLGLICPECGKALFWRDSAERSGFTRKSGTIVEATKVPSFFSHFPEGKDESETCEARVKSYVKKDIEDSKRKAYGQRRKQLSSRMLNMLSFNEIFGSNLSFIIKAAELDFEVHLGLKDIPKKQLLKYKKLYARQFRGKKLKAKEMLKELRLDEIRMEKMLENFQIGELGSEQPAGDRPKAKLSNPIQNQLHLQICHEVIDYLFESSNGSLLDDLALVSYYLALAIERRGIGGSNIPMLDVLDYETLYLVRLFSDKAEDKETKNLTHIKESDLMPSLVILVANIIFNTKWSDAFEFYDRMNSQPVKANRLVSYTYGNSICNGDLIILKATKPHQKPFDFKESTQVTIINGLEAECYPLHTSFLEGDSDIGQSIKKALESLGLPPEHVLLGIAPIETKGVAMLAEVTLMEKRECVVTNLSDYNQSELPEIEGAQSVVIGFVFSNILSINNYQKDPFYRRLKKACGKNKALLEYASHYPGIVLERNWRSTNPGASMLFAVGCMNYLSEKFQFNY